MRPRQVWLFAFGCWATIGTAILHLAAHLARPFTPANGTERQLLDLATTYRFPLPGGAERSLMNLIDGFSLASALLLATLGGVGLLVRKRARQDAELMSAVSRALAISFVALLGISLSNFFILPTMCLAAVALCFAMAAVKPPDE
jgi:hypothetical protein